MEKLALLCIDLMLDQILFPHVVKAGGNPNVDAGTLKEAFRQQCEIALGHYLTEIHELGAELSMSGGLVGCTRELDSLAARSGDTNPHRDDEPYRRALIGIYSRLSATLEKMTGAAALRHAASTLSSKSVAKERA